MEKSKAEKESKEAAEVEAEGDDTKMVDGKCYMTSSSALQVTSRRTYASHEDLHAQG